jgi:hypothetical protein
VGGLDAKKTTRQKVIAHKTPCNAAKKLPGLPSFCLLSMENGYLIQLEVIPHFAVFGAIEMFRVEHCLIQVLYYDADHA